MTGIIYCYTNKINGKKYIGQTIHPERRQACHKHEALTKQDKNYFHRAIRKHGWESFDYEILGECVEADLNELENYFITELKTFDPQLGYNRRVDNRHTEEARMKISRKAKERFESMSKDDISKLIEPMRQSNIGRPKTTAQIEGTRQANQRHWLVTSPSGETFEIINLKKFCLENGLTQSNMAAVQSGRYTNHKGWKCKKLD